VRAGESQIICIRVMTDEQPSMRYGIATVEQVACRIEAALAEQPPGGSNVGGPH
jgi:hypothetical protein